MSRISAWAEASPCSCAARRVSDRAHHSGCVSIRQLHTACSCKGAASARLQAHEHMRLAPSECKSSACMRMANKHAAGGQVHAHARACIRYRPLAAMAYDPYDAYHG